MMPNGHVLMSSIFYETSSIYIERSTLSTFDTHLVHDAEYLKECDYTYIVPAPTPSRYQDFHIFYSIFASISRYHYFYDISEVYSGDIFLVPPTGDLTILTTDHHNACLVVTDSGDTEDDGLYSIHGIFLFEDNLPIYELKLQLINSLTRCHIDHTISWHTDMFHNCISTELELPDIVP